MKPAENKKITEAAAFVDVTWDEAKHASLKRRIDLGVRRARTKRRVLAAGAALAAAAGLVLALRGVMRRPHPTALPAPSAAPQPGEWLLADGSRVLLSDGADLTEVDDGSPVDLTLALRRGSARFLVKPRHDGHFRVLADAVTVEVVGTVFTVAREGADATVTVEQGVVRVTREGASATLTAGDRRSFALSPSMPADVAAEAGTPEAVRDADAASAAPPRHAPAATEWRVLAREGDFDAAYRALQQQKATVRDDPGDQMLQADTARMSKHPTEAIAPLRRVISKYPKDPRAPLAAFTLGRVLLEETGDPRGAAEAFMAARRLQPGGPLDENALSRAVEAWSRAGEAARARALADEYYRLYPNGEKTKLVKRYAESP